MKNVPKVWVTRNQLFQRNLQDGTPLIICHLVDQATFACEMVAVAEGEGGGDSKEDCQPEQDAKQLTVAEAGKRGERLRYLPDQRAPHQLQPIGNGHDKANRTQPGGQYFQWEDRAAEEIQGAGYCFTDKAF